MSLTAFSSNIENLSGYATQIAHLSNALLNALRANAISQSEAEKLHQEVFAIFARAIGEATELTRGIARETTPYNQEEMIVGISLVTESENQANEALAKVNDMLLTIYPTAAIDYGSRCIGPKEAAVVDVSDPRIKEMLSQCLCIRRIRGEGNCFVSAFATRYLEKILERNQIPEFISFIFDQEDIDHNQTKEKLLETLMLLQANPESLEEILGDNHKILPFIHFFRALAAGEMKKDPEYFEAFLRAEIEYGFRNNAQEKKSYVELISEYVNAMGIDFCHPAITALCRRLDFSVTIIDPKLGRQEGFDVLEGKESQAFFCRHEEHYFVLYKNAEQHPTIPAEIPFDQILPKTKIVAKCDAGWGNNLFLHGMVVRNETLPSLTLCCAEKEPKELSKWIWSDSIPLKNRGGDKWVAKIKGEFAYLEVKIVRNDKDWQKGNNVVVPCGEKTTITPTF